MTKQIRDFVIVPLLAAGVVLVDQVTKAWVRSSLRPGQSLELARWLNPVFRITYVTNTGAAFGLFPGWSQAFVVVAVMVILALVWYYFQLSGTAWLMQVALGLQLGGAVGNLIDRLRFGGRVIDFVDLNFWPLRRWPVFNVADASIVAGVTVLVLLMIWEEWREGRGSTQFATAEDD